MSETPGPGYLNQDGPENLPWAMVVLTPPPPEQKDRTPFVTIFGPWKSQDEATKFAQELANAFQGSGVLVAPINTRDSALSHLPIEGAKQ